MEKFTTAKNITELETSEEKELRRTEKKRKQEQGEEVIQGLKNKRSTEKALIRAEKRRQKEAERKAELEARKRGKEILKHWKRQKEAERKASDKRGVKILKSWRKIQDNKNTIQVCI